MRRFIKFAFLLSAAGALLIGMAYRFDAITDPNGHGPANASEIQSKATRDGSFLAVAKVGFPEVIPLSRPHDVGEPVALLSDGRPIELPYRSLFPFVGDLDGDGRDELLLGTPDSGRLKVFPILGSHGRRVLGAPSWFDEKVPDGRIPKG
jgi:FG-GAP repeat